jgi:15-cis-phytoene synthase
MTPPGAVERCLETLARNSKSFHFASLMLPRACRAEAAVLYAWCRAADDAIDLAPPAECPEHLARLERDLESVYAGLPQSDLVLAAFQQVVRAREIPREYPAELLAGLAMDIHTDRYATLNDLLQYGFRVAGTVGLMMCHVMGVSTPAALRNAAHLGIAMQLTNICRDVREDWDRCRLYLPLDMLASAGAPGLDRHLGGALPDAGRGAVADVVRQLLDEAERYYRSADRGIPALPPRCALGVRTARLVYAAIGHRLAARRYDALSGRAVVPLTHKIGLLGLAATATLVEAVPRLGSGFRVAAINTVVRYPDDVLPV